MIVIGLDGVETGVVCVLSLSDQFPCCVYISLFHQPVPVLQSSGTVSLDKSKTTGLNPDFLNS